MFAFEEREDRKKNAGNGCAGFSARVGGKDSRHRLAVERGGCPLSVVPIKRQVYDGLQIHLSGFSIVAGSL